MNRTERIIRATSSLLIVAVFFTAGPVYAFPFSGHKNVSQEEQEKFIQELYGRLELSPEQEVLLKSHRQEHWANMRAIRDQIKAKKTELRQELQKPEVDMHKVEHLNSELKDTLGQMMDKRLQGILNMKKILSPEQFKKFSDFIAERKAKWKQKKD